MSTPTQYLVFYDPILVGICVKDLIGTMPVRMKMFEHFLEDNPNSKLIRIVETLAEADQTESDLKTIALMNYNDKLFDVVKAHDAFVQKGGYFFLKELRALNGITNTSAYRTAVGRIVNGLEMIYQEFKTIEAAKYN
jgi:hypothetical protein